MKPREIKSDCEHNKGLIFILSYSEGYHYSSLTHGSGSCNLFSYCKLCRQQMGYLSENEVERLNNFEFSSKELEQYFKKYNK